MRRSKEKGYDKWIDLAQCIWDLVDHAYAFRDDLTLIFLAHTQTERDETGYTFTKVKTSGRKLDKICLESKFSIVLVAKKSGDRYIFETQANNSTAKSPMGMFTELEVENDITKIIEAMEENINDELNN
jgi:AmiR/NasT family two-component response regulator